jgi:hypothetical protein
MFQNKLLLERYWKVVILASELIQQGHVKRLQKSLSVFLPCSLRLSSRLSDCLAVIAAVETFPLGKKFRQEIISYGYEGVVERLSREQEEDLIRRERPAS